MVSSSTTAFQGLYSTSKTTTLTTTRLEMAGENKSNHDYEGGNRREHSNEEELDTKEILGGWRSFRLALMESGLPTQTTECTIQQVTPKGGSLPPRRNRRKSSSDNSHVIKKSRRPKNISLKNLCLLKKQNLPLAREFMNEVWSHEISQPEVGGILCRLPLQMQLWRLEDKSLTGINFQKEVQMSDNAFLDDGSNLLSYSYSSMSPLAAHMLLQYQRGSRFMKQELNKILRHSEDGKIDSRNLSKELKEFLIMYQDYKVRLQYFNPLSSVIYYFDLVSHKLCITFSPMIKHRNLNMKSVWLYKRTKLRALQQL